MPKMKSHSGTKKRFRKTGTGKLMRAKAFKSHILSKKSTKRKRGFRQETEIAAADRKVLAQMAYEDIKSFNELATIAKKALEA